MRGLATWCCLILCGLAATAWGDTLTQDFNGTAGTVPAGWTNYTSNIQGNGATTGFSLSGSGAIGHTLSGTANSEIRESSLTTLPRQAGTDFTLSVKFTVSTFTGNTSFEHQWGVRFLATAGSETAGAGEGYMLYISRNNATNAVTLQRTTTAGSTFPVTNSTAFGYVAVGTEITIDITGDYLENGNLKLDWSVSRPGGATISSTFTDTAPLAGTLFGIRERERAFASSSLTAATGWDSFTATYTAVPEPASLGVIALAGLLVMRRRRTPC